MSYHPYWTNDSSQPGRPDGMRSYEADFGPRTRRPRGLSGAAEGMARRVTRSAGRSVWGGCDEQQRSISSVLDPGDVLRRILAGGGRDGGRRGAEGGSTVLPLGRGARRGGAGGEISHPLRRRRHVLPAARLDVAMNDTVVAIVSAFFVIGIAAGIIAVVAMSLLRAERRGNRDDDYADS